MRWSFQFIVVAIFLTALWSVPFYFVNAFCEAMILGDQCRYHSGEPGALFDLFYNLPAWNGYHPVPSILNLVVTVFLPAAYLGVRSGKRIFADRNL